MTKTVHLPSEIFDAMVIELGKRPYQEIGGLMDAIRQQMKVIDDAPMMGPPLASTTEKPTPASSAPNQTSKKART